MARSRSYPITNQSRSFMKSLLKSIVRRGRKLLASTDSDHAAYRSQAGQDKYVLNTIYKKNKRDGFFIEMGAADGVLLSNTHVFEKNYGWKGILVEPSHRYAALVKNRSATCVRACIGDSSKGIFLLELPGGMYLEEDRQNTLRSVAVPADSREEALALVPEILIREEIDPARAAEFPLVEVDVLSLTELLDRNNAPSEIDYFSLDVEGHEDAVFSGFDFTRYRFNVMNIERPSEGLQRQLKENGYREIERNDVGDVFYLHESFQRS